MREVTYARALLASVIGLVVCTASCGSVPDVSYADDAGPLGPGATDGGDSGTRADANGDGASSPDGGDDGGARGCSSTPPRAGVCCGTLDCINCAPSDCASCAAKACSGHDVCCQAGGSVACTRPQDC
jgi:hypothetical protein